MSCLRRIEVDGCAPHTRMVVEAVNCLTREIDDERVLKDAIWRISTPGSPARLVRLFNGAASVRALMERYAFQDSLGCLYSGAPDATLRDNLLANAAKAKIRLPHLETARSGRRLRRLYGRPPALASPALAAAALCIGVPQRSEASGICWWSSLCFAVMRPTRLREVVLAHVERSERTAAHVSLWRSALQSPEHAERLRTALYDEFKIGDRPGCSEEEEGQNGLNMFSLYATQAKIPLDTLVYANGRLVDANITYSDASGKPVPSPHREDLPPSVLVIRVHRSQYTPKMRERHRGTTYELQSCFIGSEWCGHQVALAKGEGLVWHYMDPDAGRLKIGPFAFRATHETFWDDLQRVLPSSNSTSTSKFCDMAPHNRSPFHLQLEALQEPLLEPRILRDMASEAGIVNVDWLYVAV